MQNLVGQDLDRYHIVEQLGKGGMAVVYKAYDHRLDRYVAIKVINKVEDDTNTFLKRFEREAKALAKLSHPHIVKIHDFGEDKGHPYLVMEYLEGGTLKQRLGNPMSYQDAIRILIPIAQAMEYAHNQNIIHRDVKPGNILFNKSGMPMLTDFGIAKIVSEDGTTDLTGTGVGIGTPDYMSPEQGTGLKLDARSDIYSLGIVFYELITGIKPFHADTPMATAIKHVTEPLPNPRQFVAALPIEVERLLYTALAKQPEQRFQTMGAFANALQSLLNGYGMPQAAPTIGPESVETVTSLESSPFAPMPAGTTQVAPSLFQGSQAETRVAQPEPEYHMNNQVPAVEGAYPAQPMPAKPLLPDQAPGRTFPSEKPASPTRQILIRILTIAGIFLLALMMVSCITLTIASIFASNGVRDIVAQTEFISFSSTTEQTLNEWEVNNILKEAIGPYDMWVTRAEVDCQEPDKIFLNAATSLGNYRIEMSLKQDNNTAQFELKKINGVPLFFIGRIISGGVNQGFSQALQRYNMHIDNLSVNDDGVTYIVSPD